MATFKFLKAEDREAIAILLSSWMPNMADWVSCSIAETLEVCMIAFSDLQSRGKSPRDCLRTNGRWHVQVVTETGDYYFARVSPALDGENWEVHTLYDSDIAKGFDAALTWIDQNIPDDTVVRIVEIPEYFIMGLVLEAGEEVSVYVVAKLPGLAIETGRLYRFEEMRDILAELQPVHGVNLKPNHSNSLS